MKFEPRLFWDQRYCKLDIYLTFTLCCFLNKKNFLTSFWLPRLCSPGLCPPQLVSEVSAPWTALKLFSVQVLQLGHWTTTCVSQLSTTAWTNQRESRPSLNLGTLPMQSSIGEKTVSEPDERTGWTNIQRLEPGVLLRGQNQKTDEHCSMLWFNCKLHCEFKGSVLDPKLGVFPWVKYSTIWGAN